MIKPLKIGNVTLKNNLLMAPLAGVTDMGFRKLARDFGAGLTCTEMISAKGVFHGNKNTFDLAKLNGNETPSAIQLFGSDENVFSEIAHSSILKNFDLIDVNMGCPVKKIVSNGEGSALLKDVDKAQRIVATLVKETKKPITVKIRKGFDEARVNGVEFAIAMEDAGASLVTIHGRTKEQMYEGKADWDYIGTVKSKLKIPVVGNGDILSANDAHLMLERTGVDGVMIARGALGRPFIFSEILGTDFSGNVTELMREHMTILLENFPEVFVIPNMRKHFCWYLKGKRCATKLKTQIMKLSTLSQMNDFLNYLDEKGNLLNQD